MAWKVISKTHFDDKVFELEDIYVLSSKGSVLTVVSDEHTKDYYRCQ